MFLYYWILAYVYDSYGVVHTVCKAHNYYIPNYIPQWILLFPHIGPGLLHRSPELARRCWDRYSKGPSTSAADIKHQETADDRCWNKQEPLDFGLQKNLLMLIWFWQRFWYVLVCFGGNAIHTHRYVLNIWFVLVCCCILFFEIHLLSQASCEPFAFVRLRWSRATFWILPGGIVHIRSYSQIVHLIVASQMLQAGNMVQPLVGSTPISKSCHPVISKLDDFPKLS